MKVKAIGMGQYKNRIIERGQIFDIEGDRHFSRRWMEKVSESSPSERRVPENQDDRAAIDEQLKAEELGVTR